MNSSGTNYQDQAVEIGIIITFPNLTKQVRVLFPDNLPNDTLSCEALKNQNYDTLKITRTFNITGKKRINVDVELENGLIKPFHFDLDITPKLLTELTVTFDTIPPSSRKIVTGMPDTMLFVASTSPAGGAIVFTAESQPALDLSNLKINTIGSKAQVITTSPKDTIYNITVTAKSGTATKSSAVTLTSKSKLMLKESSSVSAMLSGTSDTLVFTTSAKQSDTVNSLMILNAAAFKAGEIVLVAKGNDTLSFIFTPLETKVYTFSIEATINNEKDTISCSISVAIETSQLLKQDTVTFSATEGQVLNMPLVSYLADTTVQLSSNKGTINGRSLAYTVPFGNTKDTVIITTQKNSTISRFKIYLNISKSTAPKFTVAYLGNGSTSGSAPVDTNRYEAGASVTVAAAGTLARAGYTFTGWNTVAAGSGTARAAGTTFTKGVVNDTLYAQWTTNPTFTVTYNGNANTGGVVPVDSNRYETGASVTVAAAGTLAKADYTFAGWNTVPAGSGIARAAGTTFTKGTVNDTLYAQWTTNPTFTVTYNGNANTGGVVPIDSNRYETGASVMVSAAGTLARAGYTFAGWNTVAAGSGTARAAGTSFTKGVVNDTFYAQWTIVSYSITYTLNDGTNNTANPATYTVETPTVTLSAPSRTGYSFGGWYSNQEFSGTAVTSIAKGSTGDVSLFAKWIVNNVAPTITNPIATSVEKGSPATFSVTVNADAYPVPVYRWVKDNSDTVASGTISGTTISFLINTATYASAGNYKVIVRNSTGQATSTNAKLEVNDIVAPVITLTGATDTVIVLGSVWNDPLGSVSDDKDGVISSGSIIITGTPANTNTIGAYTLNYNVSDAANNAAIQRQRTLRIEGWVKVCEISGQISSRILLTSDNVFYIPYQNNGVDYVASITGNTTQAVDLAMPGDCSANLTAALGNDNKTLFTLSSCSGRPVRIWNGITWSATENDNIEFSAYGSLAIGPSNTPYVAGFMLSMKFQLTKYNANSWDVVGPTDYNLPITFSQRPDESNFCITSAGTPYAIHKTDDSAAVEFYKYDGTSWVGGDIERTGSKYVYNNLHIFSYGTSLAAGFTRQYDAVTKMYISSGSTWTPISDFSKNANLTSSNLTMSYSTGGILYAAHQEGSAMVACRYIGSKWTNMPSVGDKVVFPSTCEKVTIAGGADRCYIAYSNSGSSTITIMRWKKE